MDSGRLTLFLAAVWGLVNALSIKVAGGTMARTLFHFLGAAIIGTALTFIIAGLVLALFRKTEYVVSAVNWLLLAGSIVNLLLLIV